jgi:hypothetical protein
MTTLDLEPPLLDSIGKPNDLTVKRKRSADGNKHEAIIARQRHTCKTYSHGDTISGTRAATPGQPPTRRT